jgi:DNA-binding CsgD family transcriptional regulator
MRPLERESELDLIVRALARARAGQGGVVLLSGPAGIGKTTVLAAARGLEDVRRLTARGGELERDLALGVARQLFEPLLFGTEVARAHAFDGTGPAAAALEGRADASEGNRGAILLGLHRLVVNLAAAEPVVLEVDDVQWADAASLDFLVFLARRVRERPVLLLLANRIGEPATDVAALGALAQLAETEERTLTPLSAAATAAVAEEVLGDPPEARFAAACHRASGGNPFVLRELLRTLHGRGTRPDAAGIPLVGEARSPVVARWVLGRLDRLATGAGPLARAVAVLGDDATLGRAAQLAGLSLGDAETALDGLVESEILAAGRTLDFVHPVLRAAVRDAMPAGTRSRAHRAAARLLRDEGAAPGNVAAQLLSAEPGAETWVADALVDAAQVALAQGAPELAARHLERALAEPPAGEVRRRILRTLGNAERRLGLDTAGMRFHDALAETADPRERARTVLDLMITGAASDDAIPLARSALAEVAPVDPALALVLRARLLVALELTMEPREAELAAARQALDQAGEESLGTRLIAGMLARDASLRGLPKSTVVPLALRSVGDDEAYASDLAAGYPHMYPINGLAIVDELGLAERRYRQAAEQAERRGSLVGAGIARFMLALVELRVGALADAEHDARRAVESADATSETWLATVTAATLAEVLIERGESAAAAEVIDRHAPAAAAVTTPFDAAIVVCRSLLRLTAGRAQDAYDDAIAVGRFAEAVGARNPIMIPWRSRAALALIARGRRDEAAEIAAEALAIARAAEVASAIGAAQRVLALATEGQASIALLDEAVATLEQAPVPLELARALTDLGAALRRSGRRSAAREPLARALELAHRHGATPIAERARTELTAAGARPRRVFRTGVDSLTPSERRIAALAASGLSNADIAARLYVTVKTVEHHLAAIYRKLDIRSRRDLPDELVGSVRARGRNAE